MTRILVGLMLLCAIVEGLAPGKVPSNLLPLALAGLGLAYGWLAVDAEDPVAFLAVVIAVSLAASAPEGGAGGDNNGVLQIIPMVGSYLDSILDQMTTALNAAVVSILTARAINRLTGE